MCLVARCVCLRYENDPWIHRRGTLIGNIFFFFKLTFWYSCITITQYKICHNKKEMYIPHWKYEESSVSINDLMINGYSSNRGGGESFRAKLSAPGWAKIRGPIFSLWQWESSERMDNLDGPLYKERSWSQDCCCWRSSDASTNTFFPWAAPASWCTDETRVCARDVLQLLSAPEEDNPFTPWLEEHL